MPLLKVAVAPETTPWSVAIRVAGLVERSSIWHEITPPPATSWAAADDDANVSISAATTPAGTLAENVTVIKRNGLGTAVGAGVGDVAAAGRRAFEAGSAPAGATVVTAAV